MLIEPNTRIMAAPDRGDSMAAGWRGFRGMLDGVKLQRFVDQSWGDSIVPTLVEYIKIPNKSPAFDPDWAAHGYMEAARQMFEGWARERLAALAGGAPLKSRGARAAPL